MTSIKKCSCKNKYQDSKYGVGNRVTNLTNKTAGSKTISRCTVCNKELA